MSLQMIRQERQTRPLASVFRSPPPIPLRRVMSPHRWSSALTEPNRQPEPMSPARSRIRSPQAIPQMDLMHRPSPPASRQRILVLEQMSRRYLPCSTERMRRQEQTLRQASARSSQRVISLSPSILSRSSVLLSLQVIYPPEAMSVNSLSYSTVPTAESDLNPRSCNSPRSYSIPAWESRRSVTSSSFPSPASSSSSRLSRLIRNWLADLSLRH